MESSESGLRQRAVATSPSSQGERSTDTTTTTTTATTDEASSILSSSVQGASYLVLLQFVSRMLTFTLNQVLLRFTTAATLGIASVQLELLLNTILFLSREGVRCAAIRVSDDAIDTNASSGNNNSSNSSSAKDTTTTTTRNLTMPQPGSEAYRLQKLVNMVYAPIPVGAFMTCLAVGYHLSLVDDATEALYPGFRVSIYLYGLSALIELLAEPMFMVAQYKLWFKTRVSVEGMAVIVRCVLTCALTIYGARAAIVAAAPPGHGTITEPGKPMDHAHAYKNSMGVLAFAIAQFAYGIWMLGGFLLAFWSKSAERRNRERERLKAAVEKYHAGVADTTAAEEEEEDEDEDVVSIKALLPRKLVRIGKDGQPEYFYFDHHLFKLSKTLTAQSLLKHILTEGDKMLMTGFTDEEAQGVYAFVLNYGGILFQPMEETARTLFSRLLSDVKPTTTIKTHVDEKISTTTTTTTLPETQIQNLILSRNLLLTIMKFHLLLGLVFIAFGTHYTATLIDLVVGSYWSRQTRAPAVLSLYCWYVPIMGINGITEAVVQAVASEKELALLSYWMIGFSAVFCGTGAFLMGVLGLGAKGIVLANCVNLTIRILWSTWFLSGYYGRYIPPPTGASNNNNNNSWRGRLSYWRTIVPHPKVLVAFGAAYLITGASEQWIGWNRLFDKAMHLGIGVGTFAVVMGVVYVAEKSFLREIQEFVRQRRK
ncbi:Oligosaccharide translocation protein rft1 [Mortierella sp. NVP85]|nr:Oligosaccharide translocation protein rft1 [Mortierella sp. NVP85]